MEALLFSFSNVTRVCMVWALPKSPVQETHNHTLTLEALQGWAPCPASRILGLPGAATTGIGSKERRWLLADSLFAQARADVFGLCTRRWQGRAVHAAFTSTSY